MLKFGRKRKMEPQWKINRQIREHTWNSLQNYLNKVIRNSKNTTVQDFIIKHPITFLLVRITSLERENRKIIRKQYDCDKPQGTNTP